MDSENLLPRDGEAYLFPQVFSPEESQQLFQSLYQNVIWRQEEIILFGRKVMQPRLTAWCADSDKHLRYSGITMIPDPWSKELILIKSRVESVARQSFNGVLLNLYRDGRDSMGWHQDNEVELGRRPCIASVSFGAHRSFHFKHRSTQDLKVKLELEDGSLLLMQGDCQDHWLHCLPKRLRIDRPRINLTFRKLL
ncbi:alpha-ketoglutarate-dependent dioxygenase AlkB family protein [Pseudobacteriovorax antillogorgiicola]|uniref:Alkylated DNA repair dioxygenase AlkB n=1 Tax=Pseudobacteriovorax antillogorgiicola TaxID=1513793 RepID=A0A1Y6CM85_9BACT|nr:alpha-ketoglutarate-dependent dioxygenase AlkB [Pseudobacteriovorax antillogorgiicola]TCS44812.1 alkylated DNA repair dioxygenase AlkB [Pseudobacteriovorax antillogorgiicola]SMF77291.1 Alkylated DNA repair dioxygenase AlkB [Pseudobacteriovorax antillogorgiicola]